MTKKPSSKNAVSSKNGPCAHPKMNDKRALDSPLLAGRNDETLLQRAQDIAWDAWDAPNRRKRVSLAKKALAISPLCADAYVLLALNEARTSDDALALYQKGIEAGEKALGKRVFSEDGGHFWGILETRPYMRARHGLANTLWELGAHDEAIVHYEALLTLNPDDNQGIRYLLIDCLLIRGRDDEATKLLERFERDESTHWLWAGALAQFRRSGDSDNARTALMLAQTTNPHVADYLLGRRKLPRALPSYVSWGGKDEAATYVAHTGAKAWGATPGALAWLNAQVYRVV
jgi:tetratricopeptide (TPR) repeat protein